MKVIVAGPIGGDGGEYALKVDAGKLKAEIGYPIEKVLEPVKKNFVDKLKGLIPGDWIDKAWSEAVKFFAD